MIMSALATLTAADARLAAQLDRVTDAVRGIGTKTAAAKERLADALDAARTFLNGTMRELAAVVGLTADAFDVAASCDLLDVPEAEPVPEPAPLTVAAPEPVQAVAKPMPEIEPFAPVNRLVNPMPVEAALADPDAFEAGMEEVAVPPPPNGRTKGKRRR
jgi:hypothetical protein